MNVGALPHSPALLQPVDPSRLPTQIFRTRVRLAHRFLWFRARAEAFLARGQAHARIVWQQLARTSTAERPERLPASALRIDTVSTVVDEHARTGVEAVVAPVAEVSSWSTSNSAAVEVEWLDLFHRRALAASWLEVAGSDHAAIAAFGRLAVELLALGAPPELLARTHAAAVEKVRHAENSFSLASAYAGFPLGPDAWPEVRSLARAVPGHNRDATFVRLAEQMLVHGCLLGSYSAAIANVAEGKSLGSVPNYYREVSADTSGQVELAWSVLDWALQTGGEVVAIALALAIRNLPSSLPVRPTPRGIRPEVLEMHGWVRDAERSALYLSVRAQLIGRVTELLDRTPVPPVHRLRR